MELRLVHSQLGAGPILSLCGRRRWDLQAEYRVRGPGYLLTIPRGYCFDLASVPRALWWALAPFELSVAAPLVHDYLYGCAGCPPRGAVQPQRHFTRLEVDELFLRIMTVERVAWWRRRAAYLAVRAVGWSAWNRRGRQIDCPTGHAT